MKTVFTSQQCVHVWAQQTQREGRNSNRSIFFEGPSIYSYGRHFEMARFIDGVVLVNCARYSVTTSKHQSWVRQAITQYTSFEVPSMEDHSANIVYLIDEARAQYDKATKARVNGVWCIRNAREMVQQARAYLNVFCAPVPASHLEVWCKLREDRYLASEVEEAILRRAQEAQSKEEQARQAREAKQRAQEAEQLEKWKAGESVGRYFVTTALRVKGDVVQTSRGAEVPIIEARKLYKLIKRMQIDLGAGVPEVDYRCTGARVGHFTVSHLTREAIVIGCHTIPLDEIERIAPAVMAYKKQVVVCEDCLGIDGHEANCAAQASARG